MPGASVSSTTKPKILIVNRDDGARALRKRSEPTRLLLFLPHKPMLLPVIMPVAGARNSQFLPVIRNGVLLIRLPLSGPVNQALPVHTLMLGAEARHTTQLLVLDLEGQIGLAHQDVS